MKEKEESKRNKQKKIKKQKKKSQQQQQENYMIKDPLVTLLYMKKHAVYFEFLKCFIDIPFVKTVRRISLLFLHPVYLFPP